MRFYKIITPPLGLWLKSRFNYTYDKSFEPGDIEGPLIVCINHTCAYDPLFVGVAFRRKALTYIASEHILRDPKWGESLDKYCSIIPHQKGRRAGRSALAAVKRARKGESIFLAPEGEQTWDGVSSEIRESTGGFIKSSRATLVTYKIEGGYLSAPRWAYSTRKGKVYGHPVNVYSPDVLAEMSDEEIEAAIANDLRFDTWEWQKSQPGGPVIYKCKKGGNAEGLERAVCSCPECVSIGRLSTAGDKISCSCGFSARLLDTGFFEQPAPFETVREWEEADRKLLASVLKNEIGHGDRPPGQNCSETQNQNWPGGLSPWPNDDGIKLTEIENGHESRDIAEGSLSLSYEDGDFVLKLGDESFTFGSISDMSMVLAGRILFTSDDRYFELFSKNTNMRKYLTAWELSKELCR